MSIHLKYFSNRRPSFRLTMYHIGTQVCDVSSLVKSKNLHPDGVYLLSVTVKINGNKFSNNLSKFIIVIPIRSNGSNETHCLISMPISESYSRETQVSGNIMFSSATPPPPPHNFVVSAITFTIAYRSEMARNAIESEFRTSKMGAGVIGSDVPWLECPADLGHLSLVHRRPFCKKNQQKSFVII